jgi:GDP-4-dehydro-6-deoxy-D-mannose reductase
VRAIITGSNGFVGQYLAEYLIKKDIKVWGTIYEPKSILKEIHNEIVIRQMDITDPIQVKNVLSECKPDYIFHLAAQSSAAISWHQPELTMNVNINGTINLLESIRKLNLNPRILLIGSSEEYGSVKTTDLSIDETHEIKPGNPYAISKVAQNMIGQVYARAYDLDIVMVRAFNHIGPKQSPVFVVSDFSKRIAEIEKGKILPILKVGNLEAQRDFTDVRDIVRAYYELALKGSKGEIYNVGSGKVNRINEILNKLLILANIEIKIEKDLSRFRPLDVPKVQCNNNKFVSLTSWKPTYTLEETLKDILEYWREIV